MAKDFFDIEKAKAVVLFIAQKATGETDLLKIFKILYFAEQKHLAKYGCPIIADRYIAMKNGPVPSKIYDFFKALRGDGYAISEAENFCKAFEITNGYIVVGKEEPDFDYLSKSNIGCLEDAIRENHALNFWQLSDKSHDEAWENACRDDEINYIDIAKAGGANDEMIKYINEYFEIRNIEIA
ncbi:MAG: hypothetical protein CRN43_18035 [Candidatus Nephrothrix sp. EaCA]|nr:MAG: hypothetical protein CRN43_18035 [Candidatus Nephrothrix sp. EaCA]